MARKPTRRKYTWLPTIGSQLLDPTEPSEFVGGREFAFSAAVNGSLTTIISPITLDVPAEPDDISALQPGGMALSLGSEYFLRRIVGKCFIEARPDRNAQNDPSVPAGVLVSAGFFVARANDASSGGGVDEPIGSASPDERRDNYNPLSANTVREPWIWRRTWLLSNAAFLPRAQAFWESDQTQQAARWSTWPSNTAGYGSVMDGPHIDAKTARRVSQDERLWFAVGAVQWAAGAVLGSTSDESIDIQGYLDYRLLGQLRRARNRGVF